MKRRGEVRRSMLFLPGNTPNILMNGGVLNADSVILDLEDAISPEEKDAARILVRHILGGVDFAGSEVIVRINSLDTPYWRKDLQAVVPQAPRMIMPTKVDSAEAMQVAAEYIGRLEQENGIEQGSIGLIPLLETAKGIENAFSIAVAHTRVQALYLGAEDLTADLRCKRTKEGAEIFYARTRLVNAARAAGLEAYDTPFTDIEDEEGLRADIARAKGLGFSGKAAISPRQVACINEGFTPAAEEIEYAQKVLRAIHDAHAKGKGVVSLDGKMIDAPIVARARQTLAAAGMEAGAV